MYFSGLDGSLVHYFAGRWIRIECGTTLPIQDIWGGRNPDTGEEIRRALGDGSTWGVAITYVLQEAPLGLAHVVHAAEPFLRGEPFVFFLGDNVVVGGIRQFVERFRERKDHCHLVLARVREPQRFGVERPAELLDLRKRAGGNRELAQARCCLHDTGRIGRPDAQKAEEEQSQVGMQSIVKHEGDRDGRPSARRVPIEQFSLHRSSLLRRQHAEGERREQAAHLERPGRLVPGGTPQSLGREGPAASRHGEVGPDDLA